MINSRLGMVFVRLMLGAQYSDVRGSIFSNFFALHKLGSFLYATRILFQRVDLQYYLLTANMVSLLYRDKLSSLTIYNFPVYVPSEPQQDLNEYPV
jgi:hypothetical protein